MVTENRLPRIVRALNATTFDILKSETSSTLSAATPKTLLVTCHSTGIQTQPLCDGFQFKEIFGHDPTDYEFKHKIGTGAIGRYKAGVAKPHELLYGAAFSVAQSAEQSVSYTDSEFQTMSAAKRKTAVAREMVKASITVNTYRELAAGEGCRIWAEPNDEKVVHSTQYTVVVGLDVEGMATHPYTDGLYIRNIWDGDMESKPSSPSITSTSLVENLEPARPISTFVTSLRESEHKQDPIDDYGAGLPLQEEHGSSSEEDVIRKLYKQGRRTSSETDKIPPGPRADRIPRLIFQSDNFKSYTTTFRSGYGLLNSQLADSIRFPSPPHEQHDESQERNKQKHALKTGTNLEDRHDHFAHAREAGDSRRDIAFRPASQNEKGQAANRQTDARKGPLARDSPMRGELEDEKMRARKAEDFRRELHQARSCVQKASRSTQKRSRDDTLQPMMVLWDEEKIGEITVRRDEGEPQPDRTVQEEIEQYNPRKRLRQKMVSDSADVEGATKDEGEGKRTAPDSALERDDNKQKKRKL